jgi:hypothetical protein
MGVVAQRTSAIGSKRTARYVGLLAIVGVALFACGTDDSSPDGGGVGAQDAGGGNATDGTNGNGNDGSSVGDATSSSPDAQAGDGAFPDGSRGADAGADVGAGDGSQGADGGADGSGTEDAASDAGADANGQTLVIRVNPRNDCTVTTTPPSPIKIPAGQWFYATFINVGEISTDIAKRDQFNVVPLVLGLEPTMTYADTIRPWCQGVSGKFWFEITPCENSPYDLEVDCGP